MTTRLEPLAWDSEFFGFPIGRVRLDGASARDLDDIDTEARDLGITCLYGVLEPTTADAAGTAHLAQQHGHRLVEISITFNRPAGPFAPRPSASRVRRGTVDDLPLLEDAIRTLAPWSRFAADPRFGTEAAYRMHRAWAERAARDVDERLLAVAEDDSGITGVSTNVWSPVPRVDFMGVTKPGSGASYVLMNALMEWADGGATEAGPCAARNIAVLRYVEHCGFSVARTQYLFHRWLDDPGGAAS